MAIRLCMQPAAVLAGLLAAATAHAEIVVIEADGYLDVVAGRVVRPAVLVVDGEMASRDIQDRLATLCARMHVSDTALLSVIAAERKSSMLLLPYGIPIAIGTIMYFAWMGMLI